MAAFKNQKILMFFRRHHIVKKCFLLLIASLLVVQFAVDYLVYRNIYQPNNISNISHLIIAAVDNLHQPIPVEAPTGKRYIAQARIVLPVDVRNLGQLDYTYQPAIDNSAAYLQITQHRLVKAAESRLLSVDQKHSAWDTLDVAKVFEQVAPLQACSRGVYVLFDDLGVKQYADGHQLRATRQLADGRTLRVYTELPQKCPNTDFGSLVDYLKTAESY
jgi:hypothetical protein